jgi:hypothetical protein
MACLDVRGFANRSLIGTLSARESGTVPRRSKHEVAAARQGRSADIELAG